MAMKHVFRAVLALAASITWSTAAAAQGLPAPGPEHKVLALDAGTWDATVEVAMAPGAPPEVSKGTETNTIGCGGLCLISDFKSTLMGTPFHGHGTTAWDPSKKKYVGSWTDSMSQGLSLGETSYDAATKTATGWMEGPGMDGKVVKSKTRVEYKDANTRVMTMYLPGPDGKDVQTMKISYTRKP